jgi:tetratricopeptide (TPR) repeat protein
MPNSSSLIAVPPSSSTQQPFMPTLSIGILLACLGIAITRQFKPSHSPQSLEWLGRGKELEAAKQYEAAIAVYDEALELYPDDFRLWHERGLTLAKLHRFEAAIASYDRAHALNPNHRDLCHERGDALLELNRYEEAIVSLNQYLRYDPNNAHVLGDRGFAQYQLRRYEEALQTLDRILKTETRDLVSLRYAHHYQLKTLEALGKFDQASQSAQKFNWLNQS